MVEGKGPQQFGIKPLQQRGDIMPAPVMSMKSEPVISVEMQRKTEALKRFSEEFVQPYMRDVLQKEGTPELNGWLGERMKALPEMVIQETDVPQRGWERAFSVSPISTDTLPEDAKIQVDNQIDPGLIRYVEDSGKGGRNIPHALYVSYNQNGEKIVGEIQSSGEKGSAFDVKGLLVTKYQLNVDGSHAKDENGQDKVVLEWWQPIIDQKPELVSIWTPNGIKEIAVSGFVALLRDSQGRIAIALEQEPGAHSDMHALVRTPVQTSVSKLNTIAAGGITDDPLSNVLAATVPEGKQFTDLLIEPSLLITPEATADEVRPEPLPYADANRLNSKNLAIEFPPLPDDVIEKLTQDGKIYMATPEEIFTLHKARLLNYHAAGMVLDMAIRMLREKQQTA